MFYIVYLITGIIILLDDSQCQASLNYTQDLENYHPVNFLHRYRRQSNCAKFQSPCNDGKCIDVDLFCDGRIDCKDGSDETLKMCENNNCPGLGFRCAYGGCVAGDKKCDGNSDCADKSDELLPECSNATPNPNKCGVGKFSCNNGQCIESYDVCDGRKNCNDGSDETLATCASTECDTTRFFRCQYGACVDPLEAKTLCATSEATDGDNGVIGFTDTGCLLPKLPDNGAYVVNGNRDVRPGSVVPQYSLLEFFCHGTYQLNSQANVPDVTCSLKNGTYSWNRPIPTCLPTCPPLTANTLKISCSRGGVFTDCNKRTLHGTKAILACKEKHISPFQNNIITPQFGRLQCVDGNWNRGLFACTPVCGRRVPDGTPFVIGGENVTNLAEFPWHVGLYLKIRSEKYGTKYKQSCGGTIITPSVIVTAAHCFEEGGMNPDNWGIGAGKYFRKWDEKRDKYKQLMDVKAVHIPPDYKGKSNTYAHDIAVVVVVGILELTDLVGPVCVDWGNTFDREALRNGSIGTVTGWGLTSEGGDSSDILKSINLRYIPYDDCYAKSTAAFQPFVGIADKFCVGRDDGENVCQGDSGGGFVIPQNGVYYFRGIVSVGALKAGSCDKDRYTTFTRLTSEHLDWIQEFIQESFR